MIYDIFRFNREFDRLLAGDQGTLELGAYLTKSGYYFASPYEVKRALYIENILYTISDKIVMMNNLEDLDEINVIELS